MRKMVLGMIVVMAVVAGAQAGTPSSDITITILHNNDAESQLINAGSGLEEYGGSARFVTLVNELKSSCENPILLSSGDNFIPSPELDASVTDGIFYDTRVIDKAGYAAMCIGNHEFDSGPEFLADFISSSATDFPFLSANLDFSGEPTLAALVGTRIKKSIIVDVNGEQVGVVGATTPDLASISSPRNVVVDPNVVAAVQAEIDALELAGVDKIVLISHLQGVDEDLALIPQLSGVDVAIAGGGDEILTNDPNGLVPGDAGDNDENVFGPYPLEATNLDGDTVPVVTTAGEFKYLGKLVVTFDAVTGKVTSFGGDVQRVASKTADPVNGVDEDPNCLANVVTSVQAHLNVLAANVIATTTVPLDGQRNSVRKSETNEASLIADALLWQAQQKAAEFNAPSPTIAFQNGGGIRNNTLVPAGDYTELDTFDALPFANFVTIIPDVPAQTIVDVLERGVSGVEFTSGRFAHVSGLQFTYNPCKAAGDRVEEVIVGGETVIFDGENLLVDPATTYDVATIDFIARGGDGYPWGDLPFTPVGVSYQQALKNYIVDVLGGSITGADYPDVTVTAFSRIFETYNVADVNQDCIVNFDDFTFTFENWLATE